MKNILLALGLLVTDVETAMAGPNETPFTILVGEPSWLAETDSLFANLDHEGQLRVFAMLGSGSVQAVQDLDQFKQINAALVTSDSLSYVRAQNLIAPEEQKYAYITAIKPLPVLLISKRQIANVTALAGKRIATGAADSASFATGELLLGALEIPYQRIALSQEKAIDALAAGKADAALVLGTPSNMARLSTINFHILPIVLPPQLADIYKPIKLNPKDAPSLLAQNQSSDTVATTLVLAVNEAASGADEKKTLKAFVAELFHQKSNAPMPFDEIITGLPRETASAEQLKSLPLNATIIPTGATP